MSRRWRRGEPDQPQLANGGTRDLSPASGAPAQQQLDNWAATLPDTHALPLIWDKEQDNGSDAQDLQHF